MRVLLLNDFGEPVGGAERMTLSIRDELRGRGHEALFMASSASPIGGGNEADVLCFGSTGPLRCFLPLGNPSAYLKLRSTLKSFRPDIVHVRMFRTQLSGLCLHLLRDLPSVLHVLNYDLICPRNTKTLPNGEACQYTQGVVCARKGCVHPLVVPQNAWIRRFTDLSVFDRIVANSHWVKERLGAEGVKVDEVIWNGVPVVPQRPSLKGAPVISYSGRLHFKKGVDVLLRAMAQVVEHRPDCRLLICGTGDRQSSLGILSKQLGLNSNVDFLGHLTPQEQERQLQKAWVQVVPSNWEEPFGIVAAEAMMRGTAVVATDRGGLTEQVVHQQTGLLVPPGESQALAQALLRLVSSPEVCEKFGQAGRQRALANFTLTTMVDALLHVYGEARDAFASKGPD